MHGPLWFSQSEVGLEHTLCREGKAIEEPGRDEGSARSVPVLHLSTSHTVCPRNWKYLSKKRYNLRIINGNRHDVKRMMFWRGEVVYNRLTSFPGRRGSTTILLVAPCYAQKPEFLTWKHFYWFGSILMFWINGEALFFFYLTENCAIPWTMLPSFSETGHARPHLLRRQRNLGATISVAANVRRRSSVSVSSDISSPSSPPWRRKGTRAWFNLKVLSFIMRDYHCKRSEKWLQNYNINVKKTSGDKWLHIRSTA